MKATILWDDDYTTIKRTAVRTTVIRHYNDCPDVVTYLANDVGDKLIHDMIVDDNSDTHMPSHWRTRHVADLYPAL